MPTCKPIHIYLPDTMHRDAAAGRVKIINRIAAAVAPLGCKLVHHIQSPTELEKAAMRGGRALFHMVDPATPDGLTLRRAFQFPFWQIEAVAARWEFDVAKATRADRRRRIRFVPGSGDTPGLNKKAGPEGPPI